MTGGVAALPWWRRVGGIALLVTTLLAISVIIPLTGLQEPSAEMAVNTLQCQKSTKGGRPLEAFHTVALPYLAPEPGGTPDVVLSCRFDLDLSAAQARDAALLLPSYAAAVVIEANGQQIALNDLDTLRSLRFVTMPIFAPLSQTAVRVGANHFDIQLSSRPGRPASLARIFVGPRATLRPYYQARWFTSAGLPTLVAGGEGSMAIVFALIWATRRSETTYGWLAALLVLAAVHGTVLVPDFGWGGSDYPFWNLLVLWEVTALLMFIRAVAGAPMRRRTWLLAVPPGLLWALYLLNAAAYNPTLVTRGGIVMILAYVLLGIGTLARASLNRNRDALIILLGVVVVFPFIGHDMLEAVGILRDQVFLGRAAVSGWLMAVCTLMTLRFVQALREADQTAEALRLRVAAAEAELRTTYEELRIRREAEAVEQERARLMRDLHDGVGGELASMLALADSPGPHGAEIAVHARAALADMRLIIGSLEDYGGDLALALGAWRERAEPQVRAAGLKLDWRVDDLPELKGLGPAQVLDVLRIVQEGVTNVIKHARATRVEVAAFETPEGVAIAVRNDGPGIEQRAGGNGLRNMAMRAERLRATLAFGRNGDETELRLTLPRSAA